jgi:DNA-binding response OmpR family regulator
VLIFAREEIVAALLGLMVEGSGFQPKFAENDVSAKDAISSQQTHAVLLDCDHPEFSDDLIETIRRCGARPILFSPFRNQPEVTRLASQHRTQSFTLPTEPETFTAILRG